MSIIIRKNKHTARIMRQQYVRKGSEDNDHGFVRQVPLATISLSATQVPPKISEILSIKEVEHLERVIIRPARREQERLEKEAEDRERDPVWRAKEALRWLREVETRCHNVPLRKELFGQLHEAVNKLGVPDATSHEDPLDAVIDSTKHAIDLVEQGFYGSNQGALRKDAAAAKKWAELRGVLFDNQSSLQVSLQKAGWVLRRGAGTK